MADELQDIGRFQRAKAIYTDARELGLAAREEFIERWCAGDRTLEKIVRDLLAAELLPMPFESLAEDIRAAQDPPTALRNASEGDAGSWIGRYRLLERLGEGGFGTVFVAEQTEPVKRRVALKLIKLGMDTRQVVARFEQERQALAIMDHPCIAKVLDGGATATGRPYFVMELVKGEPVTEYCDRRKMPIRGRLEISAQICEAIHHAHQKGIIHRDIKPSNVLITTVGDKPLPKVIDFGIAKATSAKLTEKTIFTEMRQLIGTPEYMSPEQAGDTLEDIDTRTDVYSIGVLMYELLTGAPPFDSDRLRSAAYGELQRIIREEDPPRPSTRVGSRKQVLATVAAARAVLPTRLPGAIRGELDWIVMRAMEKDRSRRYDSAGSMARDIRRFLDGEPVQAAPPSTVYWLRKNLRRHRGPVAAAVLVLLALLGGLAGTSLGFFRAKAERAEAISQRTRADANALEANTERARADQRTIEALRSLESAQRQAYLANIGAAISALDSGEAQSARRRLDECPEPLRGWEWRHARSRLDTSIRVFSKAQFPSMVTEDIDISPDGRRFVTPWRDAGTGRWGARIADCETGAEVAVIPGHSGVVVSARFSPDGARVLTAGEDGYVKLFRAEDGVLVNTLLEGTGPMVRADFSPDGRRVVTISGLGVVALIDTEGGNVVSSEPEMQAYSALFMPDNQGVVVTRGFDPPALWRPSSSGPGERSPFGSFRFQANRAAPSPDGKRIAAINPGEVIRVFDADTGANAAAMRGHRGIVNSIRFSPDDHKLVTASEDGSIRVWDARSGDQLLLLLGHTGAVKRAVLSPDGSLIYSASLDGTVRVWHASAEDAGFMLSSSRTPGYSELSYAPHRDVFVALSHSSPPTLHDSRTLRVTATLSGPNQTCGAFSDDGRVLAIAGVDGSARVLDLETGEQRQLLPAPGNTNLVAVSPDHSRVAISTWDHEGWLYDAVTGHRITAIPDFRHWSATMAFTPDGRELIAGSPREEGYKRWSAADGTRLQDPPLMASHGNSLRWGPNGSLIISNQGGTAGIWDWSSGQRICELVGHSAPVRGAAFLPDGSRAVTVARDGTLRLWDPKAGTEIAVLRTCRPYPERLSISPDGSTIAVVFEDRDVQFFRSVPVGQDDNDAHPK